MKNKGGYIRLTDDQEADNFSGTRRLRGTKQSSCSGYLTCLCVILAVSNILFVTLWLQNKVNQDCYRPKLIYNPARSAIKYEKRRISPSIEPQNPFAGGPRLEHDEVWSRLIEPITIQISQEELDLLNETSIPLKTGGYIAETAVYHELHCIKRIRRHLNLDYYYPNMTGVERLKEGPHIDHCLEYLREAAMCRGDTTLDVQMGRWKTFLDDI